MTAQNLKGSPFCVAPMEQHMFEGSGTDFLCLVCGRPRALHLNDGFLPALSMLTDRNAHMNYARQFAKPGWVGR